MSWGYIAVAAGTVISGYMSSQSSKNAANKAAKGADAATAESSRQYDQTRSDLAPYRAIGGQALNTLGKYFGYSTDAGPLSYEDWSKQQPQQDAVAASQPKKVKKHHGGFLGNGLASMLTPSPKNFLKGQVDPLGGVYSQYKDVTATKTIPGTPYDPKAAYQSYVTDYQGKHPQPTGPDPSVFTNSPDYQFRRSEGLRGIESTAAAGGGAFSGNALRALNEFNSNLASSEFGNWFNRQASLAGIGQAATDTTATFGANAANQAGQNSIYAGAARASGIQGSNAAWGNTVNGLASLYGYYKSPQQAGYNGAAADPYGNYGGSGMRLA